MKVNIVILNYNGETLLPQCMPSIIDAKHSSANEVKITVIDNESTDSSLDALARYGSEVTVIPHENRVFCSFNDVAASLDDDIVILLNNDIKVEADFIDPLADVFKKHPDAFLAGPRVLTFDKKRYEGTKTRGWIEKGVFKSSSRFPGYEKYVDIEGYTAQAGFGAFDRKKFLQLNGYDDLYLPGIMEDADLCYRAWRCGFRGYYQPKSLIYHIGQASFKPRFGAFRIRRMSHRNTYLFMWKNISDKKILATGLLYLIPRMVFAVLRGKFEIPAGFISALARWPGAMKRRVKVRSDFVRSDAEVLKEFERM
ncbi:MAG: glycosyltransferase [Candidatus Omnitrophica bacterium]|nr:glycosyltransferase [Candidatus Omnitrophota bacterium]